MKINCLEYGVFGTNSPVFVLDDPIMKWDWTSNEPTNQAEIEAKLKELGIMAETVWIGQAYEVYAAVILTEEPTKLKYKGSHFNYGSCNCIESQGFARIVVIAQND